ncbi:unnamed protein product [Periconia digitata]|uniref:Amidase domain-containing protein n=1 Tax=Periconia digitata TaxID=1303443 RepID=A0A9W4US84_9PLEO|nr:unnamed protein product [Periconia digitata]
MHARTAYRTARRFEFQLGDAWYITRPVNIALPRLERQPTEHSLVTIISASHPAQLADGGWIEAQVRSFVGAGDDVWNENFLQGLLIGTPEPTPSPSSTFLDSMKRLVPWHAFVPNLNFPPGPYALSPTGLSQVYRLYDDTKNAFMVPIEPTSTEDGHFEPLQLAGNYPQSQSIAVPSRLSTLATDHHPLRGKCIAVKELFSLHGLRVALSNRAFLAVQSPAKETAPAIQKLLETGVVLLGSTKCSSMISREDPIEAVDFQAPWNPRGDGYQSPVGSSSGSAASIASYDWLDITIGSDTTGSSRRPAFVNGCFQHRFSHDLFSLKGVQLCYGPMDAPAAFTRSINELEAVVKAWASVGNPKTFSKPTVIIYPTDYLPVANREQQTMIDQLIDDVAEAFSIPVKAVSFKQKWQESPPKDVEGESLEAYLHNVGLNTFVYGFCHNHDEFRQTYQQKYGHPPFVNKVTQWRWDVGGTISHEQHNDAVRRAQVYKDWLLQNVLELDRETALVVLPIKEAEPNYRDTDPGPPFAQDTWDPLWLSPVLGAPEISVPVGNIRYNSRITKRPELLPVAVSFVSPPGTDELLVSALRMVFAHAGRPESVQIGRNMYG